MKQRKRRKPESTIELIADHPDLVKAMEDEAAAMQRYKAVMASVTNTPDAVEAAFLAHFHTIFGGKE